jgi:hypothetical protein
MQKAFSVAVTINADGSRTLMLFDGSEWICQSLSRQRAKRLAGLLSRPARLEFRGRLFDLSGRPKPKVKPVS